MSEPLQQPPFNPSQPPIRPAVASPLQRSNYGIPPRQSTGATPAFAPPRPVTRPPQPMTAGPRMMDVSAPAPAPQPVAPVAQPVTMAAPVATPAPVPQPTPAPIAATQPAPAAPAPLFTAARQASAPTKQQGKAHSLLSKARLPILVVGVALMIFGGVRMAMAGSTAGYTVAVGAVTANDGQKTTIQFTANDGILHRFTRNHSVRSQIPGTAVEVAYQPGAADATVKEVAAVKSARKAGVTIVLVGVVVSLLAGGRLAFKWLKKRASRPKTSEAVPLTA